MADFYFKAYLDICVDVPDDVDDEFSYAYDKLEQALKQTDETEGITLEDVESINPKEAPEGFYAAPTTGGLCTGCWFYVNKELCPTVVSCLHYKREDKTNVIFKLISSD